jgi:predicted Rossmann fold nucleotide-binding protein DprA/Smf involved in DNA uptake
MITFDPLALYTKAQLDIDTIAKRTGMTTSETAKKLIALRIIPSVSEIIEGAIDDKS